MRKIRVVWLDAALESHQLSPEEAKSIRPVRRENIGYEVSHDKDNLIIVFGIVYDRDNNLSVYDQTLVIPNGMVEMIEELK